MVRVLVPATEEDNEIAQWILTNNVDIVPRWTLCHLHVDELNSPEEYRKRKKLVP